MPTKSSPWIAAAGTFVIGCLLVLAACVVAIIVALTVHTVRALV